MASKLPVWPVTVQRMTHLAWLQQQTKQMLRLAPWMRAS
jgi:hypothetical protein